MKKENEEIKIIDENTYQQFKKEMCKTNDCFTSKEWKILANKICKNLTTF